MDDWNILSWMVRTMFWNQPGLNYFMNKIWLLNVVLKKNLNSFQCFKISVLSLSSISYNRCSNCKLQKSTPEHSSTCRSHSDKLHQAQYLSFTEERHWALFYMTLYKFLHNLLNVLLQIANKIWLQKKKNIYHRFLNGMLVAKHISRSILLEQFYTYPSFSL
jgi:methionyl-tRNA synthetase